MARALLFVTTNKHKFRQAALMFKKHGIKIAHKNREYDEPKDMTIQEVAMHAAKALAQEFNQPVFVDDTGFELRAYPGFPGPHPKFVITTLGYDGIFRLLRGKSGRDRRATFTTVIGYCEPGRKPVSFTGQLGGAITDKVHCKSIDVMPYQRIFVPDGFNKPMCMISEEEKMGFGHRYKAFMKLIAYLKKREKKKR